jgi:hypothetical protein
MAEQGQKTAGFLDWKVGYQPNIVLMYFGFVCCCGLPTLPHLHYLRGEIERLFPEKNDGLHWVYVLIAILGLFMNHNALTEKENELGLKGSDISKFWFVVLIIPILWPFMIFDQMNRLNAIAEKLGQE